MNVQAEKLELITWLAQLQDIRLLEQLKEFRRQAESETPEVSLKPMTVDELTARAEASNEDIDAGRIYSREQVEAALGL